MSDNIPFEIQMEIIKKVSHLKSLIRFRSVSKGWKSFIDSSDFINGYGACHTHPHSFILTYYVTYSLDDLRYIRLVEDDIEPFKVQQQELAPFVMSPLLKKYYVSSLVGACHGLLCFNGFHHGSSNSMFVIWNPSIGKSFGIAIPKYKYHIKIKYVFGFGVSPVTRDPTLVKILWEDNMPWHVEVFTLSSGVWSVIPSGNLARQPIKLSSFSPVVIDRFIYWSAWEKKTINASSTNYVVVSFDLITKEFKVVDLPYILRDDDPYPRVSVSKLWESLVLSVNNKSCCDVWVMERDSSFKKLFTIGTPLYRILGFRKNGETIFETRKENETSTLNVYDPCSQQIKNLGISGEMGAFFMGSYKESLLLVDHSDLHIYGIDNDKKDDDNFINFSFNYSFNVVK